MKEGSAATEDLNFMLRFDTEALLQVDRVNTLQQCFALGLGNVFVSGAS
jgi:hypothetical protein